MTLRASSRLAGFTFLFYIATTMAGTILFEQAAAGQGIAAKLAGMAAHVPQMRLAIVFALLNIFNALVLAVTLHALTREADGELALLAFACRVAEGAINAIPTLVLAGLLFIANGVSASPAEAVAASAVAALLMKVQVWTAYVGGIVFAVGSGLFSSLFLRARNIPAPLAWLGLLASVLVIVCVPLQLVGILKGLVVAWALWIPMLIFEIAFGLWLLFKGARP